MNDNPGSERLRARPGVASSWYDRFRACIRVGFAGRSPGPAAQDEADETYKAWIGRYETLDAVELSRIRRQIKGLKLRPRFSILLPIIESRPDHLEMALKSVRAQFYPHWQLCIAPDSSIPGQVRGVLSRYARLDDRIKIGPDVKSGKIAAAANQALALAEGDFVWACFGSEDQLAPTALYFCALEINQHPEARLIYGDEDKLDSAGDRVEPDFKPDWNWQLLRERNYVSSCSILQADLIKAQGFRDGFEDSYGYDLLLRCAEKVGPRRIRHIPRVLVHQRASRARDPTGASKAAEEHLERCGIAAEVIPSSDRKSQRVRYRAPEVKPTVSIIIPTRDWVQLLKPCVTSILEKTTYEPFEVVLVDNGSKDAAALEYLGSVAGDPRVRLLRRDEEFNYSRLNNFAVAKSEAVFVALVNNDTEVCTPDWLDELVSQGSQPGVGAVGPRLLYPDGRIQQAGVILGGGSHGVAEVAHRGLPQGHSGYFDRASLAQELSAIGGACMLVRRSVYLEVGGFDEERLKVAYNDIDFCLKLRALGYRIIYTPYAELYHLEHASRGLETTPDKKLRFEAEIQYMKEKWGATLLTDPAYNPNLSLGQELFTLAFPPRVTRAWQSP